MQANRQFRSPNFDPVQIPVEFLVLHYTAENLQSTLEIFMDTSRKVSSHLVIGENGDIYEMVECLQGRGQRAWHAGQSYWVENGTRWEQFNDFSIGIEIVNLNGNLLPFTPQQYEALKAVTRQLRSLYPALNSSQRVIGHEQIASWRGKVDPGILFDWKYYYQQNYGEIDFPVRENYCHPEIADSFQRLIDAFPKDTPLPPKFWRAISHAMETTHRLIQAQTSSES
jgi:N-acetyl-anhydromuramyl-L-alanine amidase AmpD